MALVILLAYGNLRGIREAGRVFAVPTYFFIVNMVALMAAGLYRAIDGSLHAHAIVGQGTAGNPTVHIGSVGSGLLYGATIFVVLRAFASGGSALTGTEAISNGVSIFRRPESRNARITMVLMAVILGSLVLGVSPAGLGDPPGALRVGHAHRHLPDRQVRLRHQRPGQSSSTACSRRGRPSSSSWPPTPASPASPSWPASPPSRIPTCPAS